MTESANTVLSEQAMDTIAYELHGNCYLNITNRCTLRCSFCPKFNKSWDVQSYHLRLSREPSAEEIINAVGDVSRYKQIVFCGLGEPTLRLDVLLEVATHFKQQGAVIRLNTDGLANLVHGRDVVPELAGCLDEVSISLNAQNETLYDKHCRPQHEGAFEQLLEFTHRAAKLIPRVSLSAIDGLEGVDIEACRAIADQLGVNFKHRRLDVVG